ncbi:glycosyltransferase [Aurantibacter sp.]|uniref:glycosyltransferase n=1 Tax=Aurantibacter sp. TaxID=2807103 RepID=UPI0035C8628F
MKILLVGEYSRLHNSLKEGLIKLGHKVTLISSGDGLKQYPSDFLLTSRVKSSYILNKLNSYFIRFFKVDFIKKEYAYQLKKILPNLKGFDVVQFINEDALYLDPKTSLTLYKQLIQQNKKAYLLSCGEDYTTISYFLNPKNGYSVLTPFLNEETTKERSSFSLKYISPSYKALHLFFKEHTNGVICSDIDYHRAYIDCKNYLGLIPNPINTDLFKNETLPDLDKIYIFHGINSSSKIKKGNIYFSEALVKIKQTYLDKVVIIEAQDLPYKTYIESYNKAHIVLDQTYSYDQGYNALEAMAKGKIVFTGAEKEWREFYKLKEDQVCINALPNTNYLVKKINELITNPNKIKSISKEAKDFIQKEHNYISIAKKYLDIWTN